MKRRPRLEYVLLQPNHGHISKAVGVSIKGFTGFLTTLLMRITKKWILH